MTKRQVRVVMPEPLYHKIKTYAGGNQTQFILTAIRERIRNIEKIALEEVLAEGYRTRNAERTQWAEEAVALFGELIMPHARKK